MTPEELETADAARWAELLARWDDDAAHRAYLQDRDLTGLGLAGRRYREVLARRPDDAVAARWREEILRRATVQGLAQLPRTAPPTARSGRNFRIAGWILFSAVASATAWLALQLFAPGGRP